MGAGILAGSGFAIGGAGAGGKAGIAIAAIAFFGRFFGREIELLVFFGREGFHGFPM
ncbi:MAG: hypothetical protein JO097_08185 [Acidobacteriaceae bacterium]|nr:hypothetical protein [Acidobacteriaceae bacterium]MBV9765446.1 hypothetical protein [Acidobacteriaceae bacterium]